MKNLIFAFLVLFAASCSTSQKMTVQISAQDKVELNYPQYEMSIVDLNNKSGKPVQVSIVEQDDQDFVRGFGLGMMAKESIMVEQGNTLVLTNQTDSPIKLRVKVNESQVKPVQAGENPMIKSFTLENTTGKSIPLLIPSVMNPNLSPFSKSGVDLKVGQEILFREKGKKYVLLTVDEKIQNGATLNVSELIKDKKKELGI